MSDGTPIASASVPSGPRERLAWHRALALVRKRQVHAPPPLPKRHVLAVVPSAPAEAKLAWRFIEALGWPPAQITAVVSATEQPATPPAAFIGRLTVLTDKDRGLLRLPKRPVRERIWAEQHDLALYLASDFDLGLALLVGASSAPMRAGLFPEAAAPLYDLATRPGPTGLDTLLAVLRRVQPRALPEA